MKNSPLELVRKLTANKPYRSQFINDAKKEPQNISEFNKQQRCNKLCTKNQLQICNENIPLEVKIMPKDFTKNMRILFDKQNTFSC